MGLAKKHLAPAINQFFKDKKVRCSDEEADLVKELVSERYGDSVDKFVSDGWVPGRHPLSASGATKCYLQNWFKHNQFPAEPPTPRRNATFRMGSIVELELFLVAVLAGEKVSAYQHKAVIARGGWPTNNYLDFVHTSSIDGKTRVVDCKTMSSIGYQMLFDWGKGMDDNFGYLGQMSNYIDYALWAGLADSDEGLFLCYKKDTGHIDEHLVQFDRSLIAKTEDNSRIIQEHTEYRECDLCTEGYTAEKNDDGSEFRKRCLACVGLPLVVVGASGDNRPGRPSDINVERTTSGWKLPTVCGYCDYKFSCWSQPRQRVAFDEGERPIYTEATTQKIEVEVDKKGKPAFYVRKVSG